MNLSKKHVISLVVLGTCTFGAALPAAAETSASITASSMYLWRGQSLSNSAPAVSGDLYYTHGSGIYAGIWTSSEGKSGSHETDLNVGFSKKFGEFGIDVGVYEYLYSENGDQDSDLLETDAHEWYVGGSFGPVSAKLYQNTQYPDERYLTVDAGFGKFGAHFGMTKSADSDNEYNDFNVSFTPVENLTWVVSIAKGDGAPQEDPLFVVSYKWSFDVK